MKLTLALTLVLLGCAHGVEDPVQTPDEEKPSPTAPPPRIEEEQPRNGGTLPCDRRDVITFKVDGRSITFEVPTLCDPLPYVEKGDPPPFIR